MQTVAIALGFVSQCDLPSGTGNSDHTRVYAFLRRIRELDDVQPIALGATVEAVGIRLANNVKLLTELEQAVESAIKTASLTERATYATKLKHYLEGKKQSLLAGSPGCDANTNPAYVAERDRVLAFMRKHGLQVPDAEVVSVQLQPIPADSKACEC